MKTDCLSLLKTSVDIQYGPIILCLLYFIKWYVLKYISIYHPSKMLKNHLPPSRKVKIQLNLHQKVTKQLCHHHTAQRRRLFQVFHTKLTTTSFISLHQISQHLTCVSHNINLSLIQSLNNNATTKLLSNTLFILRIGSLSILWPRCVYLKNIFLWDHKIII